MSTVKKKRGRRPTLTDEQVRHVRSLYALTSCSLQRIADHFHISQTTVARVIDRKPPYR